MKKKALNIWLLALLICGASNIRAQELKCQVTVNFQRIQGVEPRVFQNLETQLRDFMNSRVWTQDMFAPEERIECSFFIQIDAATGQDQFRARTTVTYARPIYNSNYNSPVFNYMDEEWLFTYAESQPLEFNINQYTSNLMSLLAFYSYIIIGLDYDCFSKNGGQKYFQMAETVLNNVPQNTNEAKGWRAFDGIRNRYWLINNLMGSKFSAFREALYEYHLQGLDIFYDKPAAGRANILNALSKLDRIARENPNNILLSTLMFSKRDELIGIFNGADQAEKTKAVTLLRRLDAANAPNYDKIIRN